MTSIKVAHRHRPRMKIELQGRAGASLDERQKLVGLCSAAARKPWSACRDKEKAVNYRELNDSSRARLVADLKAVAARIGLLMGRR